VTDSSSISAVSNIAVQLEVESDRRSEVDHTVVVVVMVVISDLTDAVSETLPPAAVNAGDVDVDVDADACRYRRCH
jgi:hypothetical protein